MPKFVISDTHFGHRSIIEFEADARPFKTIEEHDEFLVNSWNRTVKPEDKVFHLGDVFFRKEGLETAKRLNGRKVLIMGNHDSYHPASVYEQVFEKVYGCLQYGECILTHVPVHPCQLEHRFKLNLHGHMHSRNLPDTRYVNCSVEQMPGLAPYDIDLLIAQRAKTQPQPEEGGHG